MNYYNSETLLEQQQEIEKLKEQNAALAAQVSTLLDELNASVIAILARNPSDEIHAIACSMAESAKANPQQILAEVKAQAGRDGFIAGYMLCNDGSPLLKHNYEGMADKYADSIRRGEVK